MGVKGMWVTFQTDDMLPHVIIAVEPPSTALAAQRPGFNSLRGAHIPHIWMHAVLVCLFGLKSDC